ncbi:MAG TPA: thioredoxin domain-containing protein [Acidobacteriaceae bacterium]
MCGLRYNLPVRRSLFSVALVLLLGTGFARAQFSGGAPTTTVHDTAALKPPPGARVAIVEFEDMECPDCARANPLLKSAANQYHIPWVRHDFPLPFHAWSFDAAVYARWFDTKSKKIGDDFRDAVFAHQQEIDQAAQSSPETASGPTTQSAAAIHEFAQKFAQEHGLALPFVVDPQKKLAALVQADLDLGKRVGIEHTPTIWVVTDKRSGVPFVEVVDRDRLYDIIDQALAETKSETPPAHRNSGQ